MVVVGKKTSEEIQELRAELLKDDKADHDWFEKFKFLQLLFIAAVFGIGGGVIATESLKAFGYTTTPIINGVIMISLIGIVFAIFCISFMGPYKFDDDSIYLPKSYRYAYLTNNKNVIREEVCISSANGASYVHLDIVSLDANGEEKYDYVGMFPVVLKRNINETTIDLEVEKAYVPYNETDVEFVEDYKKEEVDEQ